jgi:hypothetical protein
MKTGLSVAILLVILESACSPVAPRATPSGSPLTPVPSVSPASTVSPVPQNILSTVTASPLPNITATATPDPTATSLASYPEAGYGPTNFPANVDPLTGLPIANPALLDRRLLAIKVSNLPRDIRPQWGLSLADIVFDYYTEAGGTRFIALYYGTDANMVGPIRSARFFDGDIVTGYKAVLAFGGAWIDVLNRLEQSDFANRLVVEDPSTPLFRYDPNGYNELMVSTSALSAYITQKGVENGRQDLNGMYFQLQPPSGGQPVNRIYVRYAAETYNRFDYDPASGKYLRFEDTVDDPNNGATEHYAQLTDKLTGQPVAFDNLVVLYVSNNYYKHSKPGSNEVIDIQFEGLGTGYAFRDGQAYPVNWARNSSDVVSLALPGGGHFALKPGSTIFEIIGLNSNLRKTPQDWRFTHHMP